MFSLQFDFLLLFCKNSQSEVDFLLFFQPNPFSVPSPTLFIHCFFSLQTHRTNMNRALVVFLGILGAGFAVLICFAISRLFIRPNPGGPGEPSHSQLEHMRAVRLRNQQSMLQEAWLAQPGGKKTKGMSGIS